MNIRQSITRNITYSIVTVTGKVLIPIENSEVAPTNVIDTYTVYGVTSPAKEMKKLLKGNDLKELPTITVKTISEQRAISIENFIKYSTIINEEENKNE